MDCNSVCTGIFQFLETITRSIFAWSLLLIAAAFVIAGLSRLRSRQLVTRRERLETKLNALIVDASKLHGPRLTAELIPQNFPSKEAAQAFGERWTRGDQNSFSAKAVDQNGRSEDLPGFDEKNSVSGRLYSLPALFVGMKEASGTTEDWYIRFLEAKIAWLNDYIGKLRSGVDAY